MGNSRRPRRGDVPRRRSASALSQDGSTFFTCQRIVTGGTMLGPMAPTRWEGAFVTRAGGEG